MTPEERRLDRDPATGKVHYWHALDCEGACLWECNGDEGEAVANAIRAAVEEEREACAHLADNAVVVHFAETMDGNESARTAQRLAAAIRARGEALRKECARVKAARVRKAKREDMHGESAWSVPR
jgi:hypothetical protein